VLRDLRDLGRLRGRCGRCEFKSLCGGCRCRAYAAFGDYLEEDPACTYEPNGVPLVSTAPTWTRAASERLDRIPIVFIREKVRRGLEEYARSRELPLITAEIMREALSQEGRFGGFRPPASVSSPESGE
jgi:hypothetical protein